MGSIASNFRLGLVAWLVLVGAILTCGCFVDGDGDDSDEGCTAEICEERCTEEHAIELADCNEICGIDAKCLSTGLCSCEFLPCHNDACATYCLEHHDLDNGACGYTSGNPLSCDCY